MGNISWNIPAERAGMIRFELLDELEACADGVQESIRWVKGRKPVPGDIDPNDELRNARARYDAVNAAWTRWSDATGPGGWVLCLPLLEIDRLIQGAIHTMGDHLFGLSERRSDAHEMRSTMEQIEWLISERERLEVREAVSV